MLVRASQLPNALQPISVRLFDSFTLLRFLHKLNALFPILTTLSGITICSIDLHSPKAFSPIIVTLLGMLMFFKFSHP